MTSESDALDSSVIQNLSAASSSSISYKQRQSTGDKRRATRDLLRGSRLDLKLSFDVAAEDASLEGLDMAADVRLGLEQVPFVLIPDGVHMAIGHDDVCVVRLHLRKVNDRPDASKVALTIKSVSQSVPLPLRRTSSGLRGMMLQSEKMNGLTYFM